jgi:xanthine/CO dehydrogenase XdhC/CoxF family maturation factor
MYDRAAACAPANSSPPHANRRDVCLDTSLEMLLERAPADDGPRVLATVVVTAGSTYRKPGARMLIMADGSYIGLLSGGCLEADLKIHAQQVLESGVPRAIEYDMRGPDDILFGIGAGCEGAMRVLLEPAGRGSLAATSLAAAGRLVRGGQPTSLVTIHASDNCRLGTYSVASPLPAAMVAAAESSIRDAASRELDSDAQGRRERAYVQFLAPPPHLLICGAGPDAQPVAGIARSLGWRVTVVDHRAAYALADKPKVSLLGWNIWAKPGWLASRGGSRVTIGDRCYATDTRIPSAEESWKPSINRCNRAASLNVGTV